METVFLTAFSETAEKALSISKHSSSTGMSILFFFLSLSSATIQLSANRQFVSVAFVVRRQAFEVNRNVMIEETLDLVMKERLIPCPAEIMTYR